MKSAIPWALVLGTFLLAIPCSAVPPAVKKPAVSPASAPATSRPLVKPGAAPTEPPWPVGKVTEAIAVEKDNAWSYHVYLPKGFDMSRKWPVLFVMSPGGGSKGVLDRYIPGAELNQWVLAVSVQSRNGFKGSDAAVVGMVDDLCKRLPIQSGRMYASGFSGGARMAFGLAASRKKDFYGVLACGAGGSLAQGQVMYGLCGSNCFNRWDMAASLARLKDKDSCLRFFPGNHDWAAAPLITDGMAYLNACYMHSVPPTRPSLLAERKQFTQALLDRMEKEQENKPTHAYELGVILSKLSLDMASRQKVDTTQAALAAKPDVKKYKRAQADMVKFAAKYYAPPGPMGYINDNGNPAAAKEATRLAELYKDTELAATFTRMGQKCVSP